MGVQVTGLDDWIGDLVDEVASAPLRAAEAVVEAGESVADVMRDAAPVDDGDLRDSITSDLSATPLGADGVKVELGPDSEANSRAFVAVFQEYGVGGHVETPHEGHHAMRIGSGYAAKVSHPGNAPQPFVGPAADAAVDILTAAAVKGSRL